MFVSAHAGSFSLKIVADGLVLPLLLQRNTAAASITSVKLCNELNSWAVSPLTVAELHRTRCAELRERRRRAVCSVLAVFAHASAVRDVERASLHLHMFQDA